jgi:hypothetical protein
VAGLEKAVGSVSGFWNLATHSPSAMHVARRASASLSPPCGVGGVWGLRCGEGGLLL